MKAIASAGALPAGMREVRVETEILLTKAQQVSETRRALRIAPYRSGRTAPPSRHDHQCRRRVKTDPPPPREI